MAHNLFFSLIPRVIPLFLDYKCYKSLIPRVIPFIGYEKKPYVSKQFMSGILQVTPIHDKSLGHHALPVGDVHDIGVHPGRLGNVQGLGYLW